jgi:predicted glycoside hydrolase/deacetylase ChbG (UPF0249 family)
VTRILVVNADDFGRSPGINRGIARTHEQGIVTSASLMVRYEAAAEAAAYARMHPALGIGLHVDLGEWVYREDEWQPLDVFPAEDGGAVRAEVERQLDDFRRLVGAEPTHLDTHQHVHRVEPAKSVLRELGARLGVPVRELTPQVTNCGSFYGQTPTGDPLPTGITPEALIDLIESLAAGVTELGCHPGEPDDYPSQYHAERAVEVETLCDPRVRAAIDRAGIELRSFRDLLT